MNKPWLTTIDCPVSAFEGKAARNIAHSARPRGREFTVDGFLQHHLPDNLLFRDAESRFSAASKFEEHERCEL